MDICVSCGEPMEKKFCPACGEKKVHRHDFTLSHFLEELVESFTHFDGKFFKTIKLLLLKPGLLPAYFSQGKRVGYMKPLQLFIVCNLFFFLLVGDAGGFALQLDGFYRYEPFTSFGTQQIVDQVAGSEARLDAVAAVFNEKIVAQSKAFIVFFVPVFALACLVAFSRSRKFLVEHLVFSVYLFAFILLCSIASRYLLEWPIAFFFKTISRSAFDQVVTLVSTVLIAGYFAVAAKRFYQVTWRRAISGALLATVLFLVSIYAYRLLLFFKIIYSIDV